MTHEEKLQVEHGASHNGKEAAITPDAPHSSNRTAGREAPGSRRGATAAGFLLWSITSLAFGTLGGYLANHYDEFLKFELPAGEGRKTVMPEKMALAQTSAATGSGENVRLSDLKALAARLDALVKETGGLKEHVDGQSRSDDSPNLTCLQLKVADLIKTTEELAPLLDRVDRNDARIDQLSQVLASIQDELSLTRSRSVKAPGPIASSIAVVPAVSVESESRRHETGKPVLSEGSREANRTAFANGSELFRKGRYQEAFDVFSGLELSSPDDARVWYYAALSRGFATKHWGNGTEQLVERGIEREKAGTPVATEIDAAFQDLTTETGKDWLASYRDRVREK